MAMNKTSVDAYLQDGCGRCEHYQTPECKVHLWTETLIALRALLLEAGLVEEMKWGSPTYTLGGKNVVMIVSFRESCALSFFKGAILQDDKALLESAGPNSHFGRFLKFRSQADWLVKRAAAKRFVSQAITLEREGKKIAKPAAPEPMPEELAAKLKEDKALRGAYEALTPGRQRSHILFISGAKQKETRERRVERCAELIREGRGMNERT